MAGLLSFLPTLGPDSRVAYELVYYAETETSNRQRRSENEVSGWIWIEGEKRVSLDGWEDIWDYKLKI